MLEEVALVLETTTLCKAAIFRLDSPEEALLSTLWQYGDVYPEVWIKVIILYFVDLQNARALVPGTKDRVTESLVYGLSIVFEWCIQNSSDHVTPLRRFVKSLENIGIFSLWVR